MVKDKSTAIELTLDLFQDEEKVEVQPEKETADCMDFLSKYNHAPLFEKLALSTFRSKFHLSAKDLAYIHEKGLHEIEQHAIKFVSSRLAPAYIPNDGKQTPMRGHPVFLAQHATGCCCRSCLYKWHHIPAGHHLTEQECQYIVSVLMTWISRQLTKNY